MALLDTSMQVLYPSILVLGIYFLFAGHNRPGGGFVGGLVIGAAISLRYVAGGVDGFARRSGCRPHVSSAAACCRGHDRAGARVLGGSILEHGAKEFDLPCSTT